MPVAKDTHHAQSASSKVYALTAVHLSDSGHGSSGTAVPQMWGQSLNYIINTEISRKSHSNMHKVRSFCSFTQAGGHEQSLAHVMVQHMEILSPVV